MLYEQKQQNENRKITWKIEKIKGVKSEIHSSRAKLKIREVHVGLPSFNSKGGVNITRGRKDERSFRKKKNKTGLRSSSRSFMFIVIPSSYVVGMSVICGPGAVMLLKHLG